jgi:hypothetical protein
MSTYEFTIIAAGLDIGSADSTDRLFEAGCDDSTVSFQRGAIIMDFDREARSLGAAIASAVADVEKAGATVIHIEPDHLVNLSDIAARTGITRAAASLYAKGERGTDFPVPVARVTTESPLWDWVDVARWFYRQGRIPKEELARARTVRKVNTSIQSRREEISSAQAD